MRSAREPRIAARFAGSMSLAKPVLGAPTPPVEALQAVLAEYAPLLYDPHEYVAAADADGAGNATEALSPTKATAIASTFHLPFSC